MMSILNTVYENMLPCDITYFVVKKKFEHEISWQMDIRNTPKLGTYKL